MMKVFGGVVIGVFVGALVLQILKQKRPGLLEEVEARAEEAARSFAGAFKNGYTGKVEQPPA